MLMHMLICLCCPDSELGLIPVLFLVAGKKASDNHAAVWVPDSEASTCMHCMKTKFTAINRRVIYV